jgi:CSLREA domain-containing protein
MPAFRVSSTAAVLSLCSSLTLADNVIVVSLTDDRFDTSCTSNCSLREAIHQANQTPGATRIVLRGGTYTLTLNDPPYDIEEEPDTDENENVRGDLDVHGVLTIIGAEQGHDPVIIRSSGLKTTGERLFDVLAGATLTLQRLTLRDGLADTSGGAIRNHGQVLVQLVGFINNRADAGFSGQGGAIANYGRLTVNNSLFEGNNANGDEGLFGRGGAIFNLGSAVVRDATFRGNTASDDDSDYGQGGALYNEGATDITRSVFINNDAGEPLYGGGGAAIANRLNGVLRLTNSTISGNPGIAVNGVVSNGINSSGGSSQDFRAKANLIHVTIAGNGGLGLSSVGNLVIRNSLIAGNSLAGMPANCTSSGWYSMRGLLLGTDQGNCVADVPVDDALTWNKVLHPLADNGGATLTHALRRGSPAIDVPVFCSVYDQRRVSRPRDGDGDGSAQCDLGAYERLRP